MDTAEAVLRWRDTWAEAWPRHDVEAIAALYAPSAEYRSSPFGDPRTGLDGVRAYLRETFAGETAVDCQFGRPLVDGRCAVVEWWGSWVEGGSTVTLAGTSVLRFDAAGLVVDHRDYWNQADGRRRPYPAW